MAGSERVFQMLDNNERIPDNGTGQLAPTLQGHLEFRMVDFAYKADEQVLKQVSFSVAPGETIALVGYTGAGKTTIANLLTRLWDVTDGRILLDGTDIRDIPLPTTTFGGTTNSSGRASLSGYNRE